MQSFPQIREKKEEKMFSFSLFCMLKSTCTYRPSQNIIVVPLAQIDTKLFSRYDGISKEKNVDQ